MVLRFFIAISPVLELRLGEAPRVMGPPARPWPGIGCWDILKLFMRWLLLANMLCV
jgi:hypothetical protein